MKQLLASVLVLIFALYNCDNSYNNDCVTIKGGGFSGFWYYYSYLKKNNITNKPIYCYSSGCLAYIASIKHANATYLYELANMLALDYNNNKITNYEIKEKFINIITYNIDLVTYNNLNILTSNYLGQCTIKKPTTISELLLALDETTNIPLVTTKLDLSKNIDGSACITFIYKCAKTITFPYDYKIYMNMFNYKLSYDDIIYFLEY